MSQKERVALHVTERKIDTVIKLQQLILECQIAFEQGQAQFKENSPKINFFTIEKYVITFSANAVGRQQKLRQTSDIILYRVTVLSSSRRRNLTVKVPLSTSRKIVRKF